MQSLRQRMLEDMRIRNLSKTTQKRYLDRVTVFANHWQKQNGWRPEQWSFCRLTIFMSSLLYLKY